MSGWYRAERRICLDCRSSKRVAPGFSSNFFNPAPCPECGGYNWTVRFSTERLKYAPQLSKPFTWVFPVLEVKDSFDMKPYH